MPDLKACLPNLSKVPQEIHNTENGEKKKHTPTHKTHNYLLSAITFPPGLRAKTWATRQELISNYALSTFWLKLTVALRSVKHDYQLGTLDAFATRGSCLK